MIDYIYKVVLSKTEGVLGLQDEGSFVDVFVPVQPVLEKDYVDLLLEEVGVSIIEGYEFDLLALFVAEKDAAVLEEHVEF